MAAGGCETGGSMTLSGKWIAASPSSSSSFRTRPGAAAARPIAAILAGIERPARYERTVCAGRPSAASSAIVGTNTR